MPAYGDGVPGLGFGERRAHGDRVAVEIRVRETGARWGCARGTWPT